MVDMNLSGVLLLLASAIAISSVSAAPFDGLLSLFLKSLLDPGSNLINMKNEAKFYYEDILVQQEDGLQRTLVSESLQIVQEDGVLGHDDEGLKEAFENGLLLRTREFILTTDSNIDSLKEILQNIANATSTEDSLQSKTLMSLNHIKVETLNEMLDDFKTFLSDLTSVKDLLNDRALAKKRDHVYMRNMRVLMICRLNVVSNIARNMGFIFGAHAFQKDGFEGKSTTEIRSLSQQSLAVLDKTKRNLQEIEMVILG